MKLYLAQHGEACTKDIDPERPLTDQGREDIERLAEFLARAGIEVARVIDSGKLRAAQTADLLAAAVAPLVELTTGDGDGRIAWWVGDLGARANIGTPDRHSPATAGTRTATAWPTTARRLKPTPTSSVRCSATS